MSESEKQDRPEFDPGRYLTKVSGSDYLEVKWRLLWFRTDHPNGVIETDMVLHDGQFAVFKARAYVPELGSATGHGSESYNDFRDYIEKAETKAIGRALAALGFGTQFTPEFEFGADQGRVVDSPVRSQSGDGYPRGGQSPQRQESGGPTRITPRQIGMMKGKLEELGGNPRQVDVLMESGPGISKHDASRWIDQMVKEGTIPDPLAGSVEPAAHPQRSDAPATKQNADPAKAAYKNRIELMTKNVNAIALFEQDVAAVSDEMSKLQKPDRLAWKLVVLAMYAPSVEVLEHIVVAAETFNIQSDNLASAIDERWSALTAADALKQ